MIFLHKLQSPSPSKTISEFKVSRILQVSFLLCLVPEVFPLSNTDSVLKGTVVNSATGEGIYGATVTCGSQSAISASDGLFVLNGLPEEFCMIQVEAKGYMLSSETPRRIRLASRSEQDLLIVKMYSLGQISGKVELKSELSAGVARPLGGLTVLLVKERSILAHKRFYTIKKVKTDALGSYLFDQVKPGSYLIVARAPSPEPSKTVQPVNTFYPFSLAPESAERIVIRPGAVIANTDIEMQASRRYKITGKMEGILGEQNYKRIAKLKLRWHFDRTTTEPGTIVGDLDEGTSSSTQIDEKGNFQIEGVAPGTYQISLQLGFSMFPGLFVELINRDVDKIVLSASPVYPLDIQVNFEGGTEGWKFPSDLNMYGQRGNSFFSPVLFMRDGKVRIDALPAGRYQLFAWQRPIRHYVKSLQINGKDQDPNDFEIQNFGAGSMAVTLSRDIGSVEGTAELEAETVSIAPEDLKDVDVAFKVQRLQPHPSGRFGPVNLPPGRYRACAWKLEAEDVAEAISAPENEALMKSKCVSFSLAAKEKQSFSIPVIRLH